MESVFNIIASLLIAVTSLVGGEQASNNVAPSSVEIGIAELSPRGESGGYAMPASGCSEDQWHGNGLHNCGRQPVIELDDTIIRIGEETELRWDPNGIDNCVLLGNLQNQGPVVAAGSETIEPIADTTYVIICDNEQEYTQTVTVRVLPRIQET